MGDGVFEGFVWSWDWRGAERQAMELERDGDVHTYLAIHLTGPE